MSYIKETLTVQEQEDRLLAAKLNTEHLVKEAKERAYKQAVDTTKDVYAKFKQIELKERCIRVKMLDWLSDKLLSWSKRVHQMSVNIDSPCAIKLPEKKTEKRSFVFGRITIGEKK
jgi:hypothetical protein